MEKTTFAIDIDGTVASRNKDCTMSITATSTSLVTTPEHVLHTIKAWEHWDTIGLVAQKEYGVSPEEFAVLLPEYQIPPEDKNPIALSSFNRRHPECEPEASSGSTRGCTRGQLA